MCITNKHKNKARRMPGLQREDKIGFGNAPKPIFIFVSNEMIVLFVLFGLSGPILLQLLYSLYPSLLVVE